MKIIIGLKKEMTQVFMEDGTVVPVTIVDVSEVYVAAKKEVEEGIATVLLGKGKKKSPNKAETGKFKNLGFVPQYLKEGKVSVDGYDEGKQVSADVFASQDKVDVTGISKGKGFQGVVKRWGFHGGPKTHGQSDRHRAPGSIGSGTTPGRVYKGKKMGGHMGDETKTVQNLRIIVVDTEHGLIAVKGSLPGSKGSLVIIKSSN